jgi:peptide/nickel transport system substrate-binding protein
MNKMAQKTISEDYVNAYLFQLALTSVVKADLQGIWADAPTQAIDLTGVSWSN